MINPRIIIATKDNEAIDRLEQALVVRGYEVERVTDGWAAIRTAVEHPPLMVLVEIESSLRKARTFGEVLKRNPRTAEVLLFVVSPQNAPHQIPAFLDGWVRSPFNPDEIAAYLIRVISDAQHKLSRRDDSADLNGDLSQVSAVDLLQMLSVKLTTGTLKLNLPNCEGAVYLRDGDIIDAELGKTSGLKALYRIVGATEGSFGFNLTDPARPTQIRGRVDNLLMEGVRQQDELIRFLKDVLSLDDLLEFVAEETDEDRPALEVEVVGLIQRFECFGDVLDYASGTDLETANVVSDLMARGQVYAVGTRNRTKFIPPEMTGRFYQTIDALRRPGITGPMRLIWLVPDEKTATQFSAALTLSVDGYLIPKNAEAYFHSLPMNLGQLDIEEAAVLELLALPFHAEMAPLWRPFLTAAVGVGVLAPDLHTVERAKQIRTQMAKAGLPAIYATPHSIEGEPPGLIRADPSNAQGAFDIIAGLIEEVLASGEAKWSQKNGTSR